MKGTDNFQVTIESKMKEIAARNSEFAAKFSNPKKNIKDCCTYVLNQVKASGCMGFTDDEVFGMAIQYYSEDVKVGKPINCNVVVNHKVDEPKKREKKSTSLKVIKKAAQSVNQPVQQSLF